MRVSLRFNRSSQWQDGRRNRRNGAADAELLSRILVIISDMPGYGYRRVWAVLRRQSRNNGYPVVNAKRVYRVMSENMSCCCCIINRSGDSGSITAKWHDLRWCSDGYDFRCDDGEKLRVTFALDCCDREAIDWAASTGDYDSSTGQDVIPGAVDSQLPKTAIQWLMDNGSTYVAHETRRLAKELNLKPCTTAMTSSESPVFTARLRATFTRTTQYKIVPKRQGADAVAFDVGFSGGSAAPSEFCQ